MIKLRLEKVVHYKLGRLDDLYEVFEVMQEKYMHQLKFVFPSRWGDVFATCEIYNNEYTVWLYGSRYTSNSIDSVIELMILDGLDDVIN